MRRRLVLLTSTAVLVLVLVFTLAGVVQAAPFPDLTPTILNGYQLTEIEVRGMSQGFPDGTWRPSNSLPRDQFVKMAVENFGIPLANPATPTFTDVPKNDIYYQFIEGAVAAGLINGVGNDMFAPKRVITRAEAAAVLVRWIAKTNNFSIQDMSAADITLALDDFTDQATVPAGLRAEVALAVELGLMKGSGGQIFPLRNLVRIEGAALLARSAKELASVYKADLDSLNNSGVTGTALLFLRDNKLRVLLLAHGLEANKEHMQHIHGLENGSQATCPTAAQADANHDGIITLAEGLPFYGPVLRPLDDPYPTADATGMIFYSHIYSGTDLDALHLDTVSLTNRVIVMHGLTLNGTYDPTLPVACGPITAVSVELYDVHPLDSDSADLAPSVDPDLVNGWGIAAGPTTFWWVADNGTDKSTLYDANGVKQSLVVDVASAPTGMVFNPNTEDFAVSNGGASGAARFLWATEEGKILGWNPTVPAANSTTAFVVADRSAAGAVYKGLAIGTINGQPVLYATDFVNGRIDVFDADFTLQTLAHPFVDPTLPTGYGPFGIQAIGNSIFVTFAKQTPGDTDETAGPGLGFVDQFTMSGEFVARVGSHGALNAPWGLALAPATGFGKFSGCLLVGNFGDGTIHAFKQDDDGVWSPRGALREGAGVPLVIDGLWGIAFGKGNAQSGPVNTLYFAAGPGDESHGLFGSITAR